MARKKKEQPEPVDAPPEPRRRLTPVDIQQKQFRLSLRGYNEGDVDQFLDEVTEEVARLYAENKRLQEQVDARGTAPLDSSAAVEAESLLRLAREEAGHILEDAREEADRLIAQAGAGIVGEEGEAAAAAGVALSEASERLMGRFVVRERDFLQGLAALIREHAEAVKSDARLVLPAARSPASPSEPAPQEDIEPEPDASIPQEGRAGAVVYAAIGAGEGQADGPPSESSTAVVRLDEDVAVVPGAGASENGADLAPRHEEPAREGSLRALFWGED